MSARHLLKHSCLIYENPFCLTGSHRKNKMIVILVGVVRSSLDRDEWIAVWRCVALHSPANTHDASGKVATSFFALLWKSACCLKDGSS